jgi:hypothetical protein
MLSFQTQGEARFFVSITCDCRPVSLLVKGRRYRALSESPNWLSPNPLNPPRVSFVPVDAQISGGSR